MYSQLAYNKSTIRVIFYYPNWLSFISVACFLLTKTPYSHCAIEINGALYDCINGEFQCNGTLDNISRKYYIYDTGVFSSEDTILTLEYMLNNTFEYKTSVFFRYLFNIYEYRKPYCTQAVAMLLSESGYEFDFSKRIGFHSILTRIRRTNRIQN